ncbi:uncharacterized protein LOC129217560 [Uloborus diversus]|uniref:uncharacterized protein LOC129217560 n=1 Tax=Uloborus diversus TaxID=327109 RepID=UPI0024093B1E|nr:uncharacterized protein LOC129217560 [Uloborus diversus]
MILAIAILFCSCVTLQASDYPSYYISEYPVPRSAEEFLQEGYGDKYGEDYDQDNLKKFRKYQKNYGDKYEEDYDQSNLRKLQKSQEKYGAGKYNDEQDEYLRDLARKQAHKSGAEASLKLKGGEKGHESNAYDRGSYEKEKKYGYEKAYGYEKEVKNHDKKAVSSSFAKDYNHNEKKANYKEEEAAFKDRELKNKKRKSGSQSEAAKDFLLDLNEKVNRGKKYISKYGNENNDQQKIGFVQQPVRIYKSFKRPVYVKSYEPEDRSGYNKNRYFPGLGLQGYGMEYEFNPYRSNYLDEFLSADQGMKVPLINPYGQYQGYYSKSS